MRRAIGDLITCPWCSAPWVATGLLAGLTYRPRATRAVAGMLSAVALSDFLQHAWDFTREATKRQQKGLAPAGFSGEM